MALVFVMPGVERRDLAGVEVPSEQVLQSAIDKGVTDVIVVGRSRNGDLYLAGAPPDVDRAVGILMRAASTLSTSSVFNDGSFDTEPKVTEPKVP